MILEKGDMFSIWGKTNLFLVTTNPIVTKLGKCVMGRGIAKQIADKHPEIPFALGHIITENRESSNWRDCGIIGIVDNQTVGYFMVKSHWFEPAELDIIKSSTEALMERLELVEGIDIRVDLNFPGIGNGKLAREDVLPIIEQLPDNVHVWEYGE